MTYKLRNLWVNGVPPAPLIGERLSAIDFDFMRIKEALRKEIPFLAMEEIMIKENNVCLPGDCIIGEMMIAGFKDSAVELRQLIRQDFKERQTSKTTRSECFSKKIPEIPLGENTKKLRMLSEIFCELEHLAHDGLWKMIIISRLELAEAMQKVDTWLAQEIVKSCLRFISKLEESIPEDRIIIAEVHLTKAYFSFTGGDVNPTELHNHLKICFQMVSDHKDKKMYSIMSHKGTPKRQGLIKIAIERPVGLHGWHNYDKVATVQDVVTLRNTSLYRIACIIACLSQLNLVQQQENDLIPLHASHHRRRSTIDDHKMDDLNVVKELQQTFSDAIAFAKEGENSSCLLQAIYICGEHMKSFHLYDTAQYVYRQLELKSQMFEDQETLGITYNRLGSTSKRLHLIKEAVNYFGEEWEIGHNFNLPILRIDALLDLGKLLLEEGHIMEAEMHAWHAYEELNQVIQGISTSSPSTIDSKGFTNMKYSFTGDPIHEKAWTMTAIIMGQSKWPRLAGNCRNLQLYPVTLWKTSRHPIHGVFHIKSQKPVTITTSKKHYDITKLNQKISKKLKLPCLENCAKTKKLEAEARWLKQIDDEDFNSMHDLIVTTNKQKLSTSISEESEDVHKNEECVYEIYHGEELGEYSCEEVEPLEEEVEEEQDINKDKIDPRDLSWVSKMVTDLQDIYNRRRPLAEEEFREEILERARLRRRLGMENSSEEEDEGSHSAEFLEEEESLTPAGEGSEEDSEEDEEDEEVSSPSDDDDEQEWDEDNELTQETDNLLGTEDENATGFELSEDEIEEGYNYY